jgi:hypothetical protein
MEATGNCIAKTPAAHHSQYHNITVHVAYPLEQRRRPPASVAIGYSVFTARAREAGSPDLSRSGLKAAGER